MNTETQSLGELSPLIAGKNSRRPDRREVSKRWLASSVLVGITSSLLMGGALFAALDGREQLTVPAIAYNQNDNGRDAVKPAVKGNNPGLVAKVETEDSNIIMASILTKEDGKNIVKAKPFMKISTSLAIPRQSNQSYPAFDALKVFSGKDAAQEIAKSNELLYGAEVESEVSLNIVPFPYDQAKKSSSPRQRSFDIMRQVREAAFGRAGDGNFVSALTYFNPDRFAGKNQFSISNGDVTITAENVSILKKSRNRNYDGVFYEERTIEVNSDAGISQILSTEGLNLQETRELETVLASDLGTSELREGDTIQAWFEVSTSSTGEKYKSAAKLSLYRGKTHLVSIARSDDNRIVYAVKPESPEELNDAAEEIPAIPAKSLPTIYDGIYRSALAQGLNVDLAGSLIRIFAFDLDFKSRVGIRDEMDVFISLEPGEKEPTEESEILYASIKTGKTERRYYRFQDAKTGYIDYYDETGKSAKKFLLRRPVPNGKFRSAFGMRRHPISRRYKLHGGVDFSAPRGTPILAAGNGVVEKAGWAGGSGKRTILRHANGYETYYLHQTRYARGIKPGARVRQGQIIGYVGSTGYSTGPHLHYEVHVNGRRVDPMRIKLPKGRVLKEEELVRFEAERDRIDALVNQDAQLAALN